MGEMVVTGDLNGENIKMDLLKTCYVGKHKPAGYQTRLLFCSLGGPHAKVRVFKFMLG